MRGKEWMDQERHKDFMCVVKSVGKEIREDGGALCVVGSQAG